MELDGTDRKILGLLQQDASLSSQQNAERVKLSQSPCWRRINRLEQAGLLARKVSVLDREKLGMDVVVFATVNLSAHGREHLSTFEAEVAVFSEVLECYTMTGAWDYMLKIVTKDIRHYERFIRDQLMRLPGIGEIHSHIAVTEIKNSTELPLTTQL